MGDISRNATPERRAKKYMALFLALIALGFFRPALPLGDFDQPLLTVLIAAVLLAGVYSVLKLHRGVWLTVSLAVIALALSLARYGLPALAPYAAVARGVFMLMLTGLVFVDVLYRNGRVDSDRLYGAAAVYLLLAIAWAEAYMLVHFFDPNAFRADAFTRADASYFSFVTQTTLGYGDIVPLSSYARSLAVMQSTLGVLYVAILVARLAGASTPGRPDEF